MTTSIRIDVDNEMSTGYVSFSRLEVSRTVSISDLVNLDLDLSGNVVGLELLDLNAKLPEGRLVKEFRLDANLVQKLNAGLFR
jgi:uncharacterized protein YuzE